MTPARAEAAVCAALRPTGVNMPVPTTTISSSAICAPLDLPLEADVDFPHPQGTLVAGQDGPPDQHYARLVGFDEHRVEVAGRSVVAVVEPVSCLRSDFREPKPRRSIAGNPDRFDLFPALEVAGNLLVGRGELQEPGIKV